MSKSSRAEEHDWRLVAPLEVAHGRAWTSALFCTFALSLGFFEAVLLPHFRRSGAREIDILADPHGVRDALGESGARDVGRAYTVQPCWAMDGVFHPKLVLLGDGEETHMLVGSGNLTFGGWGVNTEVIEHLVADAHPAAFGDVVGFLERLAGTSRIQLGDPEPLGRWADRLRRPGAGASEGSVRVLHNVDRSIAEQLGEFAEALGGADKVLVASPYFGGVDAVVALAKTLKVGRVDVHVPDALPFRGEFFDFAKAKIARPVEVSLVSDDDLHSLRPLHAKIIEIVCRHGRLTLTGSVNASMPALIRPHNIELGVLRIDPSPSGALRRKSVPAPALVDADVDEIEPGGEKAVIFAHASGTAIEGLVMAADPSGTWTMGLSWPGGRLALGDVIVDAAGRFSTVALPPEEVIAGAGRVIVQLRRRGRIAEGFLALGENLELGRTVGAAAGAMLRTASGAGDDEDLATVLEWIALHPQESLAPWRSAVRPAAEANETDRVVGLDDAEIFTDAEFGAARPLLNGGGRSAIERLLVRLRLRLRELPAAPTAASRSEHLELEDLEDGQEATTSRPTTGPDPVLGVFDVMWATFRARVGVEPVAALMQMSDLAIHVLVRRNAPVERIELVLSEWTALAVEHLSAESGETILEVARFLIVVTAMLDGGFNRGRRRLLHLAHEAGADPFEVDLVRVPLAERLVLAAGGTAEFEAALRSIRDARTVFDDLVVIRDSLLKGLAPPPLSVVEEEPEISAIRRFIARGRGDMIHLSSDGIDFCPRHGQKLPAARSHRLRIRGLATTECCDRVLVNLRP